MKLTKEELRNIINKDWDARREKLKERAKKNAASAKKWKAREKLSIYENELHMSTVRRFRHYLGNGPVRNM